MNRTSILGVAAVSAAALLAITLRHTPSRADTPANTTEAASIPVSKAAERGGYLVKIMGCNDCHTPWIMTDAGPEPDMSRQLSGHPQDFAITAVPKLSAPWESGTASTNTAFAGPWGVSFTANLTPDAETGLGKWTVETFLSAIRTGRHEGQGRPILPPMPWPMYRNATDEDLRAIYAYLRTIPPVRNRVPLPLDPPGAP